MNSPFDTFAELQSEEGKLLAVASIERAVEATDSVACVKCGHGAANDFGFCRRDLWPNCSCKCEFKSSLPDTCAECGFDFRHYAGCTGVGRHVPFSKDEESSFLNDRDIDLLREIYEHFDSIADGAPDSSRVARMANNFLEPLEQLIARKECK